MTISVYSSAQGPLGTTVYTFDGVSAPAQFIPTLTVETEMNAAKTNTQYRIRVEYPLVTTVDGVTLAPNTLRANFSFSALRNVINTAEKQRIIDEIKDFLNANVDHIINGNSLP